MWMCVLVCGVDACVDRGGDMCTCVTAAGIGRPQHSHAGQDQSQACGSQ